MPDAFLIWKARNFDLNIWKARNFDLNLFHFIEDELFFQFGRRLFFIIPTHVF